MANPTHTASLQIHLLDVGTEKYGDCIVCELGQRRILIDGAHPGDYQARDDRPSIPDQLEQLFGHAAPFKFNLLVVTHCHSDHIGCLPTLVSKNIIETEMALVADETLGFGRSQDFQPAPPDALTLADKLAAALREEDYSHLPDDQLANYLEDLASLESRYGDMLATLEKQGKKIIRYTGNGNHQQVETAFKDFGLKVLGPTVEQLKICSTAIARSNDRSENDAARVADADLVTLYRSIVGAADAAGAEDRPGKGAALNDQSIVLKINVGAATALLAGDMQFAKPEIAGLAPLMKDLRASVKAAGPYRFIKLPHHSSYNGFDGSLLQEWSPSKRFAHTGGLNDSNHPDPGVLQLLVKNGDTLQWARTDRNGLITVTFLQASPKLQIACGKLNDATPNSDEMSPPTAFTSTSQPVVTTTRVPGPGTELTATAKIGPDVARVTVTFDVTPTGAPTPDIPLSSIGRRPLRPTQPTPVGLRPLAPCQQYRRHRSRERNQNNPGRRPDGLRGP